MNCEAAKPLVPLYLDGELSEVQAAELRPHLLSCAVCRSAVQADQALRSWFLPTPAVAAPEGFAARVARRAFAGDQGTTQADELSRPNPAVSSRASASESTPILQFALRAVAAAAAVLIVFAVAIRRVDVPAGDLRADGLLPGSSSLEGNLEALKALNEQEKALEADEAGEQE